jgi:TolB protein
MKIILLLFFIFSHILLRAQEPHLKNIQQLTYGGDNAEAYFSFNGRFLTMQSNNKNWGLKCDQIFKLKIAEAAGDSTYKPVLISTGKGRTTCSYFLNKDKYILYASTHAAGMIVLQYLKSQENIYGLFMILMIFMCLI